MKTLNLQFITTKDGSTTLLNTELGSTYHSRHGALTESEHVFILHGLERLVERKRKEIAILEMGFGTGLNALLTALSSQEHKLNINYHTLELFPVPESVWSEYRLPETLAGNLDLFDRIHRSPWNVSIELESEFHLFKHHISLLEFQPSTSFDLIYYDAFEPETQPELWTSELFLKLFNWMSPNAILTTYCCKGYVRRNMIAAGFVVEKVPGPPGKREMIVAHRPL